MDTNYTDNETGCSATESMNIKNIETIINQLYKVEDAMLDNINDIQLELKVYHDIMNSCITYSKFYSKFLI